MERFYASRDYRKARGEEDQPVVGLVAVVVAVSFSKCVRPPGLLR